MVPARHEREHRGLGLWNSYDGTITLCDRGRQTDARMTFDWLCKLLHVIRMHRKYAGVRSPPAENPFMQELGYRDGGVVEGRRDFTGVWRRGILTSPRTCNPGFSIE
jgi:hypothetical protein